MSIGYFGQKVMNNSKLGILSYFIIIISAMVIGMCKWY